MSVRPTSLLLLVLLALSGCDKLKAMRDGGPDPKVLDAEAVGYACRVSQKAPEDCMKENDAHSPSSVLNGWKRADSDIKAGTIDPTMSNVVPQPASSVAATDEAAHDAEPDDAEAATDNKSADKKGASHDSPKPGKVEKSEKSGNAAHATDKATAEKTTGTNHEPKSSHRTPAE